MTTSPLSTIRRSLLLATLVGFGSAASHAQLIFSDNFTTDTLSNYTIMGGPGTNITYGATDGVGGGGGLVIAAGSNPSTSLIPTATSFTASGGSVITISAMLRSTSGGTGSRMFLGLSDQGNYAWGGGPATDSSALGASFTSGYALTARRTTEVSVENVGTTVGTGGLYESEIWYKFTATLTKPSSGISWNLNYTIQDFGADGLSAGATLATFSESFNARGNGTGAADISSALTTTYLNFGVRNGSFDRMDDLSVTVIPEPSSVAALAGLLGLGFAAARRRRA
jgi:hypothetical protein